MLCAQPAGHVCGGRSHQGRHRAGRGVAAHLSAPGLCCRMARQGLPARAGAGGLQPSTGTPISDFDVRMVNEVFTLATLGALVSCPVRKA